MKYKVGDKVRVKSLEWYNKNKDANGTVNVSFGFIKDMMRYCGKEFTVTDVLDYSDGYLLSNNFYIFSDEMLEEVIPDLEIPAGYEVDKIESGKVILKKSKVTTYDTIPEIKGYTVYQTYKSEQEAISAIAMAKISQLLPYYGGAITNEEWGNEDMLKYCICCYQNRIECESAKNCKHFLAFHTEAQREKFMSYPENIQLIKDYLMID